MKVLTAWENLTVICLPRVALYVVFTVTSATWAFKSALSGVLCQRLSENPDERCCEPRYCQIYILHLNSVWQFYLSGIFLSSFDLPLLPWPWDQTTGDTSVFDTEHPRLCLCHVWITVHCMIISAALVRRSSWKLLLSGSEVGGGELRMRKRDQGAPAMLKFHNRTMRMRTLIRTTRSSTLASSRLPGRKLTALTVYSFLLKTLFVVILNRPLQTSPKGLVSIRWCCLY